MTYIDTHTHLYTEEFNEDRDAMIQRAIDSGVTKIFLPNISKDTIDGLEQLVNDYPGTCYPMMGIHPSDVVKDWETQLTEIKTHYKKGRHIAIGEIGIDLYWDKSLREEQISAFRAQVQWAKEERLPVSIHCRDAFDEILAVLDDENDENMTGILHCFTGTEEQAKHIINYGGFKLGIGGIVTFKNAGLDKTLENIDLQHLVLETDSPYLAPAPNRGKRNESAFLPLVAKRLSNIYGISETEVGEVTTKNALEIFKIKA